MGAGLSALSCLAAGFGDWWIVFWFVVEDGFLHFPSN
jgi:hypothetical protein